MRAENCFVPTFFMTFVLSALKRNLWANFDQQPIQRFDVFQFAFRLEQRVAHAKPLWKRNVNKIIDWRKSRNRNGKTWFDTKHVPTIKYCLADGINYKLLFYFVRSHNSLSERLLRPAREQMKFMKCLSLQTVNKNGNIALRNETVWSFEWNISRRRCGIFRFDRNWGNCSRKLFTQLRNSSFSCDLKFPFLYGQFISCGTAIGHF